MKGLSLVVPVHNGEKFIAESLGKYHDFFSKYFSSFEIIVVCNACTDNTLEKCNSLISEIPLKVLNAPKRGKGYALTKGFAQAQYEIVGFLDSDNPFNLEDVLKMIAYLEDYDVVVATKFKKGRLKFQTSVMRRMFSIAGAVVSRFIFNLDLRDTQAGAKFMKKEFLDKINNDFICGGFEYDVELLYKLKKRGAKIKEVFMLPRNSDFSTVKMRILPGMLYRLLKLRILK